MTIYHSKATAFHIQEVARVFIGIKFTTDVCSFEIKEFYSKLESHILSISGVSATLAPIILAEIGDINNFDKPSKLIAFGGTDLSENQSGNKRIY